MARKPGPGLDTEQVLRAAAALVDEEGWEQLSLARLAERLGIRTPSLYNHINGLDGLRRDLGLRAARELLARMTKAAHGRSGSVAIYAVGHAYRAFAHEHPGLYPTIQRAPDADDAEYQEVARETVNLLLGVVEPFGFNEEGSLHAVRGLRSLAHGFVSLEAAGGFGLELNLDESYAFLLHVYVGGMGGE
jgi:AcrR family transcriptional regulator